MVEEADDPPGLEFFPCGYIKIAAVILTERGGRGGSVGVRARE